MDIQAQTLEQELRPFDNPIKSKVKGKRKPKLTAEQKAHKKVDAKARQVKRNLLRKTERAIVKRERGGMGGEDIRPLQEERGEYATRMEDIRGYKPSQRDMVGMVKPKKVEEKIRKAIARHPDDREITIKALMNTHLGDGLNVVSLKQTLMDIGGLSYENWNKYALQAKVGNMWWRATMKEEGTWKPYHQHYADGGGYVAHRGTLRRDYDVDAEVFSKGEWGATWETERRSVLKKVKGKLVYPKSPYAIDKLFYREGGRKIVVKAVRRQENESDSKWFHDTYAIYPESPLPSFLAWKPLPKGLSIFNRRKARWTGKRVDDIDEKYTGYGGGFMIDRARSEKLEGHEPLVSTDPTITITQEVSKEGQEYYGDESILQSFSRPKHILYGMLIDIYKWRDKTYDATPMKPGGFTHTLPVVSAEPPMPNLLDSEEEEEEEEDDDEPDVPDDRITVREGDNKFVIMLDQRKHFDADASSQSFSFPIIHADGKKVGEWDVYDDEHEEPQTLTKAYLEEYGTLDEVAEEYVESKR